MRNSDPEGFPEGVNLTADHCTKNICSCVSPICGLEDAVAGVDGSELVGVGLDPDARVVPQREEVVHDLEAVLARRHVHPGDVDQTE